MSTPEWLRPVSQRYLGGEVGPPPRGVRVAAVLAGANALAAAGMVLIWAPMTIDVLTSELAPLSLATAPGLLAVAGAVLLGVLAPATVMILRRGWYRAPLTAGWVLGGLALFGLCVAAEPSRVHEQTPADWEAAAAALPWLVGTAVTALGMSLLLRTDAVSTWLARRRYQVHSAVSAGASD
jgi:hypothetical protein